MATNEEKKGILIDPLEWAKRNQKKLKTVRIGNTNVTPGMMIRDKREDAITQIRDSQDKNILIELSYRNYVLFHKICYSVGLSPTEFVEKLCALYEVNNSLLLEWLKETKSKSQDKTQKKKIDLTEDELYDMLEELEKGET